MLCSSQALLAQMSRSDGGSADSGSDFSSSEASSGACGSPVTRGDGSANGSGFSKLPSRLSNASAAADRKKLTRRLSWADEHQV